MPLFVSMLRGINVGGARPLKMERLKEIYLQLGLAGARSYLQSGNVVFRAAGRCGPQIERAIARECGLDVSVVVLSAREMSAVVARNPLFGRPNLDPAFLHATFLDSRVPRARLGKGRLPLGPGEEAVIVGKTVYLYCPNGYGKTKLNNAYFERTLGTHATTRNWRTVVALERMGRGGEP